MTPARETYAGNGLRKLEQSFGPVDRDATYFIDHHAAHASSAYPVGFDDALVLVDRMAAAQPAGDDLYHAREGRLELVKSMPYPNSLGSSIRRSPTCSDSTPR